MAQGGRSKGGRKIHGPMVTRFVFLSWGILGQEREGRCSRSPKWNFSGVHPRLLHPPRGPAQNAERRDPACPRRLVPSELFWICQNLNMAAPRPLQRRLLNRLPSLQRSVPLEAIPFCAENRGFTKELFSVYERGYFLYRTVSFRFRCIQSTSKSSRSRRAATGEAVLTSAASGRGDDAGGSPPRARNSQLELLELRRFRFELFEQNSFLVPLARLRHRRPRRASGFAEPRSERIRADFGQKKGECS